jgi:hypothetical protein
MIPLKSYCLSAIGLVTVTAHLALAQSTPTPTPHQIVFTESSPTSLLVTYDGSVTGVTVSNPAPDQWNVEFPNSLILNLPGGFVAIDWLEPEDGHFANQVVFENSITHVFSDFFIGFLPGFPDGTTLSGLGTDSRDNVSISVTFNDDAAMAEVVPEPPTSVLILLPLTACLLATRLRRPNQAMQLTGSPGAALPLAHD